MSDYEATKARYDELVSAAGIKRKGKGNPYTSSNGYMFSQLNKDGEVGIRLSKEDGAHYSDKYGLDIFKSYNAVMRGYVKITPGLLKDDAEVIRMLKKGQAYVDSLEPK